MQLCLRLCYVLPCVFTFRRVKQFDGEGPFHVGGSASGRHDALGHVQRDPDCCRGTPTSTVSPFYCIVYNISYQFLCVGGLKTKANEKHLLWNCKQILTMTTFSIVDETVHAEDNKAWNTPDWFMVCMASYCSVLVCHKDWNFFIVLLELFSCFILACCWII